MEKLSVNKNTQYDNTTVIAVLRKSTEVWTQQRQHRQQQQHKKKTKFKFFKQMETHVAGKV